MTPPVAPATYSFASMGHTEKRKTEGAGGALKDRRRSSGAATLDKSHSHPVQDDGDHDADHSPEDEPAPSKVSAKRKEQNRNAQRAFRERKEKHMSTLENRIDSLEQKTVEQGAENDALRELLARLQEENERLRSEGGSSISPVDEVLPLNPFDFVPSLDHYDYNQPPAATLPIPAYAQDASTSTPALNVRRAVPFASTATEALLDLSSIMPMVSTNHENFSYLDVAGILSPMTIEAGFNFTYSNDKPSDSLGSIPPTFGSLSPLATGSNFVYPPLRTTGPSEVAAEGSSASSSSGARSARSPSTPPSFIGADYRDVGFAGKDYGFGNGMELGGIAGDDITDFSAFLAGSPAPPTPAATVPSVAPASVAGLPCGGKDGYSFDLDGLCKDMAKKATCQDAARLLLQEAMKEDALAVSALYPKTS